MNNETDKQFSGSIPKLYEQYLVPLIFEPYAADLARRLAPRSPARVLDAIERELTPADWSKTATHERF